MMGHRDSILDLHIQSAELEAFNDFIQSIEDVVPGTSEEIAPHIRGAASWDGKMTGPLGQPVFTGHVHGERIAYGKVHLDLVEGDVIYSPSEISLSRGHLRYGAMQADLEASLDLDKWSFRPKTNGAPTPIWKGAGGAVYSRWPANRIRWRACSPGSFTGEAVALNPR